MTPTENFDLSGYNTLGLPSRARYGAVLNGVADISEAARFARARGMPFHLLGGGSNCVLDADIPAFVGVLGLRGRSLERDPADRWRVIAQGGETWTDLVSWTVGQDVGGLENLAGIPGTVGAAPVQNIGAYGVELSDILERVTALDTTTGELEDFSNAACRFSYRHSRFKDEPGRYVVVEVALVLPAPWRPVLSYAGLNDLPPTCTPDDVMQRVIALRSAKLPDWRKIGNVGSFFHNPVVRVEENDRVSDVPGHPVEGGKKLSAGWLIEACGLKGVRQGGAGFSETHALVIVNHGGACFADVMALAALAKRTVKDRFDVTLVQEPTTLN